MSSQLYDVTIEKLVHGGQGLGELPDGRKAFVWNALPGEMVSVRIIKEKKSYVEAIAERILRPSDERIAPLEENYLATSPWQMMTFEAENIYKGQIVEELFRREKVNITDYPLVYSDDRAWQYRNKMEYSFWGDEAGLHLALHQRGSHGKQIVEGSQLAMPAIDMAARAVCSQLSHINARAGDLKTLVVRASQDGMVVAALYTKLKKFSDLQLPDGVSGLRIYHSDPKSPASVETSLIYEKGNGVVTDRLLGQSFDYTVNSFFQVNPPVFEHLLKHLKSVIQSPQILDMYAGVGTIGLSVAHSAVTLVELDATTAMMATRNAKDSPLETKVMHSSSEQALQAITGDVPVVVDPPRAGLHSKIIQQLLTVKPPSIYYVSCNPATQARDIFLLQQVYAVADFKVYNFFPRTPHIETYAELRLL